MKVVILSESPADEAVVKILAEATLGSTLQVHEPTIRHRVGGWTQLCQIASAAIRACYFQSHDVDGLIVVLDSDDTQVCDDRQQLHPGARLAKLQCELRRLRDQLNAKDLRPPLHLAMGMAAPSLEAWLLCGVDPQVNESAWCRAQRDDRYQYDRRQLKIMKYGSTRNVDRKKATDNARRLATDIESLHRRFPICFGCFATDLAGWRE